MFRGNAAHSLDDKGRVIIPQKFRLLLGEKFIITIGVDRCLWVFTEEEFRQLEKRLEDQPMLSRNALVLQRRFCGEAIEVSTDTQGRVALPANLREFAGIDREVAIVGANTRLEIWDRKSWEQMMSGLTDEQLREAAREVGIA